MTTATPSHAIPLADLRPGPALPPPADVRVALAAAAEGWALHAGYLSQDVAASLGDLLDSQPTPPATVAAGLWAKSDQALAVRALAQTAPFRLDALGAEQLAGYAPDSPKATLLRYRLAEIALALLDAAPAPLPDHDLIHLLLRRQRFRYLSALAGWAGCKRAFGTEPTFTQRWREARWALAEPLLEQPRRAELAFDLAEPPPGGAWDVEAELRALVFAGNDAPLAVATATAADRQLTDTIIRRGFLARNNLGDATRAVAALAARGEGAAGWPARALPHGHAWFIGWSLLAAFFFWLGGLGLGWWAGPFLVAGAAAVVAPALGWLALWRQPGLQRAALYPLALRVPGLAVLGLSLVAGLSGYLPYAFNAWGAPGAGRAWPQVAVAWFIFLAAPLVTLLYVMTETLGRVHERRPALRRALWLTAYLWAMVFWLSLLAGWFAAPVGMMACAAGQAGCVGGQLALTRAVAFPGGPVSTDFVFFVGALALLVGLLTQLFWEDKSVAEPL